MQKNLHQEIPEFFAERAADFLVLQIFSGSDLIEDVEHFVGFFDEVLAQGLMSLRAIPGAATGRTKAVYGFDEMNQFFEPGIAFGRHAVSDNMAS